MEVYVSIEEGNFGDLEAFGGVFATHEAAIAHYGGTFEENTYSFNGQRYWVRRAQAVDDSEEEYEYDKHRAVVIREIQVKA